jgi:hypothetical protein
MYIVQLSYTYRVVNLHANGTQQREQFGNFLDVPRFCCLKQP